MKIFEIKKKKALYLLFLLSVIGLVAFTSCEKDDPEPEPIVPVVPTPSPAIKPNPAPEPEPQPEPEPEVIDTIDIVSYRFTPANLISEQDATLEVTFNHPAVLTSVKGEWGVSEFTPVSVMSEDKLKLTLTFPMYEIGAINYHISIGVKDAELRREWKRVIDVAAYETKVDFEGFSRGMITDYERETCWVATKSPNRLYRFNMSDPEHPIYKDFDSCPNVLAINPYNGKLYVGSTVTDYEQAIKYDRKMYILDPTTLNVEESITVSFDNPSQDANATFDWPDASPLSMAFTSDGYGIIVRQKYGSSGTDLCYVDSKNGNKVTVEDCWELFYGSITTKYDEKELIIQHLGYDEPHLNFVSRKKPTPRVFNIDYHYRSDDYYSGGDVMHSVFLRDEPKYLVQSPYSMCLIDYSKDTYSPVFINEGRTSLIEYDYGNKNHALQFCRYNNIYAYADMTKGKAEYSCRFTQRSEQDEALQYVKCIPEKDKLIFVTDAYDFESHSFLVIFDMKVIRGETINTTL